MILKLNPILEEKYEKYPSVNKWLSIVGIKRNDLKKKIEEQYSLNDLLTISSEKIRLTLEVEDDNSLLDDFNKMTLALKCMNEYIKETKLQPTSKIVLSKYHWDCWTESCNDTSSYFTDNKNDITTEESNNNTYNQSAIEMPPPSSNHNLARITGEPQFRNQPITSEFRSNAHHHWRHDSESSQSGNSLHSSLHRSVALSANSSRHNSDSHCMVTSHRNHSSVSSSSGCPHPPSPTPSSLGENDSAFVQHAVISPPYQQYHNNQFSGHYVPPQVSSPGITMKALNVPPNCVKISKSAEENFPFATPQNNLVNSLRVESAVLRSESTNSIDTLHSSTSSLSRGKKKKRKKKVEDPINLRSSNGKQREFHLNWSSRGEGSVSNLVYSPQETNQLSSKSNNHFFNTSSPAGSQQVYDSKPSTPRTPRSNKFGAAMSKSMSKLKKKATNIFRYKTDKNAGSDTTSISSDSISCHDKNYAIKSTPSLHEHQQHQMRSRIPSTPANFQHPHNKCHPVVCPNSSEVGRKTYPYASVTSSPATPRHRDVIKKDDFAFYPASYKSGITKAESDVGDGDVTSSNKTLAPVNSVRKSEDTLRNDTAKSEDVGKIEDEDGSEEAEEKSESEEEKKEELISGTTSNEDWEVPFTELILNKPLKKGRVGEMYRGSWHGEVVVRVIKSSKKDVVEEFKKEMNIYKKTRHENIELYMASCIDPPKFAIVTTYCKTSLYDVIRDRNDSSWMGDKSSIAQQIANGMGYLHSKNIVHKDLKSKNVFFDGKNYVITDFGLMGIRAMCGSNERLRSGKLEICHEWLPYLAPEIVRALRVPLHTNYDVIAVLPYNKQSDIYAFGTILYEILTATLPYTPERQKPGEFCLESNILQISRSNICEKYLNRISVNSGGNLAKELLSSFWNPDPQQRQTFTRSLQDQLRKLLPMKMNRVMSLTSNVQKKGKKNKPFDLSASANFKTINEN